MDAKYPTIRAISEGSILVEYEEEVSLEVNRKARRLTLGLEQRPFPGLVEIIPTYRSVVVYFDPLRIKAQIVTEFVKDVHDNLEEIEMPPPRLFRIPKKNRWSDQVNCLKYLNNHPRNRHFRGLEDHFRYQNCSCKRPPIPSIRSYHWPQAPLYRLPLLPTSPRLPRQISDCQLQ